MGKITKKLIKYFLLIITSVVLICLIVSSIFLSKFYMKQQYNNLKSIAEDIYTSVKEESTYETHQVKAILIKDSSVTPLTKGNIGKGKAPMMNFLNYIDLDSLKVYGKVSIDNTEDYLYYNLSTDLGNIVVFQTATSSIEYMKLVYILLSSIFLMAIIVSIPLISYFGKKLTMPILKIQKASSDVALGNLDTSFYVKTEDEIEELSESLKIMTESLKRKYDLQRDFLANVSHDFKTPLSIIRNYSEAIKDGIINSELTYEYSNEIINEVDRLNNLVMDIMQLSKLQEGTIKINRNNFNLNSFVNGCINNFSSIAKKKSLSIIFSTCNDININNIYINGDENYLLRVMYNFIDNAIKFSHVGKDVQIIISSINDDIKISILNYGEIIPKNKLAEIWDRYYKHSQSGGMGLGLAICSQILKLHNFGYGVNSSYDTGTEFYFIIPKCYIS